MSTLMNRSSFPTLDFSLAGQDPNAFQEQLRQACHRGVGLFLLRQHGVPNWREQLHEARTFLYRPISDKRAIAYEEPP
jgi:hypothetical protein